MRSRGPIVSVSFVLMAGLAAGCGAAPGSVGEEEPVATTCGADVREDPRPKAPDARLSDAEAELAGAAAKEFGEAPGLYAMVVEAIMQADGVSAEEAMRRAAIEYRSEGADGAIRSAAGDAFGGIWIDPENGGKYTVAVTRDEAVPAVEAALGTRGLLDDSAVVVVQSTEKELERAQTALEDLVFGEGSGLGLGIDVAGNCVVAEVDSFFLDAEIDEIEHIADELGVQVHVERVDETAGEPSQTGVITEVDPDRGFLQTVEDDCPMWVSEGKNTEVVHQSGEAASWDDLAPGMAIDVWLRGGVADSCPSLGGAAKVVIKD